MKTFTSVAPTLCLSSSASPNSVWLTNESRRRAVWLESILRLQMRASHFRIGVISATETMNEMIVTAQYAPTQRLSRPTKDGQRACASAARERIDRRPNTSRCKPNHKTTTNSIARPRPAVTRGSSARGSKNAHSASILKLINVQKNQTALRSEPLS
jgi:hypothetical protein